MALLASSKPAFSHLSAFSAPYHILGGGLGVCLHCERSEIVVLGESLRRLLS
jgi:hypothetical protein